MENKASNQATTAEKSNTQGHQAYGSAKTESLRDSGLWRILLPGLVAAFCLALIAFPLIILTPLFFNSLNPAAASNVLGRPLTWIWIVMALVEASIIIVVVRGLVKIFMTQAGNYPG